MFVQFTVRIQFLDQQRIRVRFFADEFEFRFVIERGLLRFFQPRFAERLQSREIVRRHDVICQNRRVERELRARVRVELAGFRQIFDSLKNRNRRARLRTERVVNRTRRNPAPRQRDLRFQNVQHRARKIRRRLPRDDDWFWRRFGGRNCRRWRADDFIFLRMLAPPEKINRAGNQNQKNQPAKSAAAAFFASGVKRLEIGLARHERSFKFQLQVSSIFDSLKT